MKPVLLTISSLVLLMASCQKQEDYYIAPVQAAAVANVGQVSGTVGAKPGLPPIKGCWRLTRVGGGIMGAPLTPVTYSKALQVRADFTFTIIQGTSVTNGTYALSTIPIPYTPGIRNIITFSPIVPPPSPGTFYITMPPYRYTYSTDTMVMAPNVGADMEGEEYVRY